MAIDQGSGQRMLHRIQKQPPTWKTRDPLRIYCGDERTYSGVHQLVLPAQVHLAARSIAGGHERSIRNPEAQIF
jgi:hypothetical protein